MSCRVGSRAVALCRVVSNRYVLTNYQPRVGSVRKIIIKRKHKYIDRAIARSRNVRAWQIFNLIIWHFFLKTTIHHASGNSFHRNWFCARLVINKNQSERTKFLCYIIRYRNDSVMTCRITYLITSCRLESHNIVVYRIVLQCTCIISYRNVLYKTLSNPSLKLPLCHATTRSIDKHYRVYGWKEARMNLKTNICK